MKRRQPRSRPQSSSCHSAGRRGRCHQVHGELLHVHQEGRIQVSGIHCFLKLHGSEVSEEHHPPHHFPVWEVLHSRNLAESHCPQSLRHHLVQVDQEIAAVHVEVQDEVVPIVVHDEVVQDEDLTKIHQQVLQDVEIHLVLVLEDLLRQSQVFSLYQPWERCVGLLQVAGWASFRTESRQSIFQPRISPPWCHPRCELDHLQDLDSL